MKIPRISNPKEFVEVIFTDMGDVRPAYDKNGNAYEAYTSQFEFDGKIIKNHVDLELAKLSGDRDEFRFKQDCAFLKNYDLNLAGAIFE